MSGVERIAAERQRQIEVHRWSPQHDHQEHVGGELVDAAYCYVAAARGVPHQEPCPIWPWEEKFWKPSEDPIRNLEKAGALIAAEIDRLEHEKK